MDTGLSVRSTGLVRVKIKWTYYQIDMQGLHVHHIDNKHMHMDVSQG